jgi:hypothetical protein
MKVCGVKLGKKGLVLVLFTIVLLMGCVDMQKVETVKTQNTSLYDRFMQKVKVRGNVISIVDVLDSEKYWEIDAKLKAVYVLEDYCKEHGCRIRTLDCDSHWLTVGGHDYGVQVCCIAIVDWVKT